MQMTGMVQLNIMSGYGISNANVRGDMKFKQHIPLAKMYLFHYLLQSVFSSLNLDLRPEKYSISTSQTENTLPLTNSFKITITEMVSTLLLSSSCLLKKHFMLITPQVSLLPQGTPFQLKSTSSCRSRLTKKLCTLLIFALLSQSNPHAYRRFIPNYLQTIKTSWINFFSFFLPTYLLAQKLIEWVCVNNIFLINERTNLDPRILPKKVY